jgi:subtilisin-like proprotein convertase family protein
MSHGLLSRRKRLALIFSTALLSLGATAGTASAVTNTFANPAAIAVPDVSPGSPYPSSINVTGFAGNVQKVTATLHGYQHTCLDDTAVLLAGPSGANSILMGRVGGCSGVDDPIDLTFDEAATSLLNDGDVAVSGTYRTSQGATIPDPFSAPAPAGPYPVNLGVLNGTPANGTWKLFVEDQVGGDDGSITRGWSLKVTAPVNTFTTGAPTLNKKKGTAQVPVTVPEQGQVTLTGNGVATVASPRASKSVALLSPGNVSLPVRAKGKKKKKLNSKGKVKVNVTITFTPTDGTPRSTPLTVKLKKTLKK